MRISDWSSDVCSSDLLAPALHQVGARHLCLNLDDADVATAASLRQKAFDVQPAAIAQVWVDSAITFLRRDIDAAIARYAARHAAYLVTESAARSEEHTSELQSLMRISYAVFCLKKKKPKNTTTTNQ